MTTATRILGTLSHQPDHAAHNAPTAWLVAMLDEIDYPMLLLADRTRVVHANKAARQELEAKHPLQLQEQHLQVRCRNDAGALHVAIDAATQRGLRRMVTLRSGALVSISVVPLCPLDGQADRPALLVFGKREVCEPLSLQWFAQGNGLTGAETQVLQALCAGLQPQQVALRHGVAVSTVRTQIGSIRAKTGSDSIRTLVRQVATLPPLVSVLRGAAYEGFARV